MKKKLLGLFVATFSIAMLSSCSYYQYKSGKLEELVGTYKLKTITKRNGEEDYSYKDQIGAEVYFTLDSQGYSYYAYKDNSVDWKVTQMFSTINEDEEKPGYYKSIEMNDGLTHKMDYEKEVGCLDEPPMGFNSKTKTFSYTITAREPNLLSKHAVGYQYVCYEKVSNNVGLASINAFTGKNFSFQKPFELGNVNGLYYLGVEKGDYEGHENPNYGKIKYAVMDTNSYSNGKMDVHYALESDGVRRLTQANFEFVAPNNGVFKDVKLTLHIEENDSNYDFEMKLGNGLNLGTVFEYTLWSEPDDTGTSYGYYSNHFYPSMSEAQTIDELIEELISQ